MKLTDTPEAYGPVSRINHWAGAALILALLGIGLYFHEMPRGDTRLFWLKLHVALGALAFPLLAFRLAWRAATPAPPPPRALARHTHRLLLALIAVLILSGPLTVWSGGRAIDMFGVVALPSPMGKAEGLHALLEKIHAAASRLLLVLVALHVAAALKHALIDRDDALGRMLGRPQARGRRAS
ncbi:MAG: cytochrome b/b6 domain-containing protein [Pseudomonadota bacterium]|jgi:cytochrome b561